MKKQKKEISVFKKLDETIKISNKKGNGILKFSASADSNEKLTRYSLTYVNANIYKDDNGRVLGYDNHHGHHHRHYMGHVEPVDFISFTDIYNRFEIEWRDIHEKHQNQKK